MRLVRAAKESSLPYPVNAYYQHGMRTSPRPHSVVVAVGLSILLSSYTLAIAVAQTPAARSPEGAGSGAGKIDCVLGEISPTPTVECGDVVVLPKPIAIPARNGGAPCPKEFVEFKGDACVCPDGSKIDPDRTDCEELEKEVKDGCCVDPTLCPDGSRKDPAREDCVAPEKELVDGCCRDVNLCPDKSKRDPARKDCTPPEKELVNGCCKKIELCPDGSEKDPGRKDCVAPEKELVDGCCEDVNLCPDNSKRDPARKDCTPPEKELVNGCCKKIDLCPDGSPKDPQRVDCTKPGYTFVDGCCVCPCCTDPDPCCGNPDPCCGNPDPCCGSSDPDCGMSSSHSSSSSASSHGGGGTEPCPEDGDPGLDCMGPGCCGTSACEDGQWVCHCFGTIRGGTGMGSTPDQQCIDANGTRIGYYDYDTCGCKFDDVPCPDPQPCYNNGVACGMQSGPSCECPPDCNNNGNNFDN